MVFVLLPLVWLLFASIHAFPQTYSGTFSGTFTGAVQVNGGTGESNAVPAVCPAGHPVSCSSIGESSYCCPSGNQCGWYTGVVGCCPYGQNCYANPGGGGYHSYQPSSTWRPTSTYYQAYSSWRPSTSYYQPQTTTVYNNGGYAGAQQTTTAYQQPEQTTEQQQHGGFCSTITETGPGLPTTYDGDCGTILVVNDAWRETWMGFWRLLGWLLLVHGIGWALLVLR